MTRDEALAKARKIPCWTSEVSLSVMDGGITNHNILVVHDNVKYIVRLGEDIPEHGVMRWHELMVSNAACAAGLSPAVFYNEPGVIVLEYIESKSLEASDLHDAKTLVEATGLIEKVHKELPKHLRGNVLSFWVFHILRDYAATLREKNSGHCNKLDKLLGQADLLEKAVGSIELVFGHNDLLPANLLKDRDRLWLIDWEYAGFNSPLFDLGGLASNCELDAEAERLMLKTYYGAEPSAGLLRKYEAMKCSSLLRETMWSMVSEITSNIDFDYAEYTAENLEKYKTAYANFLGGQSE